MKKFENHLVILHKSIKDQYFPSKKISILVEILLKMFKDLPNIPILLFIGQDSIIGGCRSRSSQRLLSCSSRDSVHMLRGSSGMMSRKTCLPEGYRKIVTT